MGTRSVVAVPDGDGWKGRYIHWDGYPGGVGEALRQIVARDGLDVVIKTLTQDHYGWSTVDADDEQHVADYMDDGRFEAVPGYGVGYTTAAGQSSPEDWITNTGDDMGTEYAYVLEPDGMHAYERRWNTGEHMTGMFGAGAEAGEGHWRPLGVFPYTTEVK